MHRSSYTWLFLSSIALAAALLLLLVWRFVQGPGQVAIPSGLYALLVALVIVAALPVLALGLLGIRQVEQRRLNHYLGRVVNAMPSVLVGVDQKLVVVHWNRQAEQSTGTSSAQALNRPLAEVFPRLSKESVRIEAVIRERRVVCLHKRSHQDQKGVGYEDVTIYPLEPTGSGGAVIRIDDISRYAIEEERKNQREKMLAVSGLATGVAHEVNNPLTGLMQSVGVIHSRLGEAADIPANRSAAEAAGTTLEAIGRYSQARGIPRTLAYINEAGSRIAAIVDTLVNFAGRTGARVEPFALEIVIDRALELAADDHESKSVPGFDKIRIRKEYDGNLPLVLCDAEKIQQAVLGILSNAAQALRRADIEHPIITIRTRLDSPRQMAEIEFQDNGPGMEEATARRVFEPFFTAGTTGEGMGLGLSLAYFIVSDQHGGELEVESQPGLGTTFVIRLPQPTASTSQQKKASE